MNPNSTKCKPLVIEFEVGSKGMRHNQLEHSDNSIYHIYPTLLHWDPSLVPEDNNPRSHDENILKKPVAKEIFKTLRGEEGANPEDFHLVNRGCTIFVSNVEYDNKTNKCRLILTDYVGDGCPHGMADGATTNLVLEEFRKEIISEIEIDGRSATNSLLSKIRVHLEVIVGLDNRNREDIAKFSQGRNTSIQVKAWSLANFTGEFNWLKGVLKKYNDKIAYEENDIAEVTVLEVIAILNLFNPYYGLGNNISDESPTNSYSGKTALVAHFAKTKIFEGFQSMEDVMLDILELRDYVISKYQDAYKGMTGGSKLFALTGHTQKKLFKGLGSAKKDHRPLPFSSYKTNVKSMPVGLLFPILASMRCLLVKGQDGKLKWAHGIDPRDFFNEHGSTLMKVAFKHFEDLGRNPNAFGKSSASYDLVYNRAKDLRPR